MDLWLTLEEQEALRGMLRFAQAPASSLKDGDWLNALEDALRVAGGGSLEVARKLAPDLAYPLAVTQSKAWLSPVQQPVKELTEKLFETLAGNRDPLSPSRAPGIEFDGRCSYMAPLPFQLRVIFRVERKDDPVEAFTKMLLLSVGDRISRLAPGQLRQCPECKRIFVGFGKQRFDTAECSGRFRVREFRKAKPQGRSVGAGRRSPRKQARRVK